MTFTPGKATVWGLGSYDAPELQFNGTDDDGVQWVLERVQGWRTTSVDTPVVESAGDGGWFAPGRRKPRVLTLRGGFRGRPEQLDAAEDRLRGAVERLTEDQVLWAAEAQPKQLAVRLTGECNVDETSSPRVRTFSAVMTAADPLKYAAGAAGLRSVPLRLPQDTSANGLTFPVGFPADFGGVPADATGRVTVEYPGTQPVLPLVTYTGPVSGPTLRHLGLGVAQGVAVALAEGQQLLVNHASRRIAADTRSLYSARIPGTTFFPLVKGRNDLLFTADAFNTHALATVTYRPAWS